MPTFQTSVIQAEDMNATGIAIPASVVETLASGKRPKVLVTLKGYTYRTTVAAMGGQFVVPLAAEHRQKAGVAGGDKIAVTLELDTAPREVEVPKDLAAALKKASARAAFDALAYSHRREHVRAIEEAKTPETRVRRIAKAVQMVQPKTAQKR